MMQLDESDPIELPVALIAQNNVTADPRRTKDLVALLTQSSRLSVSITEIDGTAHTYVFSLQPNDIALAHCE
jgi:hypothetical protein